MRTKIGVIKGPNVPLQRLLGLCLEDDPGVGGRKVRLRRIREAAEAVRARTQCGCGPDAYDADNNHLPCPHARPSWHMCPHCQGL